ncbi:unnamed protein product [Sympodiomycopsis kandeliae]
MRVHLLGVGSVGTLLAHHLRRHAQRVTSGTSSSTPSISPRITSLLADSPRILKHYDLTLHLRSLKIAEQFAQHGTSVERAGIADKLSSQEYDVEVKNYGSVSQQLNEQPQEEGQGQTGVDPRLLSGSHTSLVTALNDPRQDLIDTLIITTKSDSTIKAMHHLVPRLTSHSTVVLLQNGMGLLDEIIREYFPHDSSRPNFVIGNLSHGIYAKRPCQVVHAGWGSIRLAAIPTPCSPQPAAEGKESLCIDIDESFPANQQSTLTLRATLLHMLSLPLDVSLLSLTQYNTTALEKLAVNACINSTSALYKCTNGQLIKRYKKEIWPIWRDICSEAGQVFAAVHGHQLASSDQTHNDVPAQSPNSPFKSSPSLTSTALEYKRLSLDSSQSLTSSEETFPTSLHPLALLSTTSHVAQQTRSNYSSMYKDVHGLHPDNAKVQTRASSEIDYINGYIVRLGQIYGVHTPRNAEMVERVKELCRDNVLKQQQQTDS